MGVPSDTHQNVCSPATMSSRHCGCPVADLLYTRVVFSLERREELISGLKLACGLTVSMVPVKGP